MHTCPASNPNPHVGGPIQPPGKPTVIIGGQPAATVGSVCLCSGGPPDSIIEGSATVKIGGKPAARVLDKTSHGGVITTGFLKVIIGG
jgi:uncharacterized Zn-binding protein involved in type VI secretion